MSQHLRPVYRGIVRHIPYNLKHRVNVALIRSRQLLQAQWRKWYTRSFPPSHPIRAQFLRQISWWCQLRIRRKEPVLIYQMGKVGSSSIYYSLSRLGYLAIHIHSLDVAWLLPFYRPDAQTIITKQLAPNWNWIRRNVIRPKRKAKIITLTRDPVAINIANFFQNLDINTDMVNAQDKLTVTQILEKYLELEDPTYEYQLRWFDQEFKKHLGIDVFRYPFDYEKGFCRIRQGPYDVLILKLELDDSEKTRIIADFLATDQFELVSSNVAADKAYGEIYRNFKQQIRIPSKTLDRVYNSPLATHFYTSEEIQQFRAKWE